MQELWKYNKPTLSRPTPSIGLHPTNLHMSRYKWNKCNIPIFLLTILKNKQKMVFLCYILSFDKMLVFNIILLPTFTYTSMANRSGDNFYETGQSFNNNPASLKGKLQTLEVFNI